MSFPIETHGGATTISDHNSKTGQKKPKFREVSSRFLSPTSSTNSSSTEYRGIPSPTNTQSPLRQKPRSSTDSRKPKSLETSGFLLGLWPSSSNPSATSNSKPDNTLAVHLGNNRIKDLAEKSNHKTLFLNRQKSSTEFDRFDNGNKKNCTAVAKENHKPVFGDSMRYTGKLKSPGKSSSKSNNDNNILPGRFSIDEIGLRKEYRPDSDSESESNDMCSGTSFDAGKSSLASYMAPTMSSRKHGIEVPSKSMNDLSSRSRRWSADSNVNQKSFSSDSHSPKIFTLKSVMKKANSKWGTSPGRASSPTTSSDMMSFSTPKPPTSPSNGKKVGNIISMGIELLKGKKYSSSVPSALGSDSAKSVHQLRLLHNSLIQWRYVNARADATNKNIIKQSEGNILGAWNGLIELQHSVVQKKIQLQKEKLEMKLSYLLKSQIKSLEIWGNMEKQHLSAVSITKDYLHSVVCKIPLIDGAKIDPQSASSVVRHASDVAASINFMLTSFSPAVEETVGVLIELAMVVSQEKLLLEECLELFKIISALEIRERSLKSSVMQLKLQQLQLPTLPITRLES